MVIWNSDVTHMFKGILFTEQVYFLMKTYALFWLLVSLLYLKLTIWNWQFTAQWGYYCNYSTYQEVSVLKILKPFPVDYNFLTSVKWNISSEWASECLVDDEEKIGESLPRVLWMSNLGTITSKKTDGSIAQKHFKININTSWDKILIKNAVLIMLTVVDIGT